MSVNKFIPMIGIDEAGRGPLAGPVAVGGVLARRRSALKALAGIRDSKQLTPYAREEWFHKLIAHPDFVCTAVMIPIAVIDRINIRNATLLGARRVYRRLAPPLSSKAWGPRAFLDGGLFLPHHLGIRQETIIKGDEKIPLIAAASIIAKVRRDRLMRRLHKKYPEYRFDLHKGYGTRLHREMIQKFGRCEIHRQSFSIMIP